MTVYRFLRLCVKLPSSHQRTCRSVPPQSISCVVRFSRLQNKTSSTALSPTPSQVDAGWHLWPFVSHSWKLCWAPAASEGPGDLSLAPMSKRGCLWAFWCCLRRAQKSGRWQVLSLGGSWGFLNKCLDVGFEGSWSLGEGCRSLGVRTIERNEV